MSLCVAITGLGCVSHAGVGVAVAREALAAGLRPVPPVLAPPLVELEPLLPGLGFPRPPRTSQLCLLAAREAWAQAALPESREPERLGLALSRNHGQHQLVERYLTKLWDSGPSSVSGLQFVQTIANTALGLLAMQLTLRGPSELFFGPPALGLALDWLRLERADAVLVGGFDECSEFTLASCAAWGLDPQSFLAGDAAAFVMLEPGVVLGRREQAPLGYLCGYATLYDRIGRRNPLERHPDDLAQVIRLALADAKLPTEAITCIVANAGAGLEQTDAAEQAALEQVFGTVPMQAHPKAVLGETWGAAGCLGLIAALEALKTKPGAALVLCADFSGQNVAFVVTTGER